MKPPEANAVVLWIKLPLWYQHPPSEYKIEFRLLLFQSNCLLMCLGSSRWQYKYLDHHNACGRPEWNSMVLDLAWFSPDHYSHWGANQRMENLSLSFLLSPALPPPAPPASHTTFPHSLMLSVLKWKHQRMGISEIDKTLDVQPEVEHFSTLFNLFKL